MFEVFNFIRSSPNKETYFMWHVGIDLHRITVVLAAVNDNGEAMNPITIPWTIPGTPYITLDII